MGPHDLYQILADRGFTLWIENEFNLLVRPASELTDADRELIRENKTALVKLLTRPSRPPKRKRNQDRKPSRKKSGGSRVSLTFKWGGEKVVARRYKPAMGQVYDRRFALDCETEVVEFPEIPRLALVSVSDGEAHYLVHPDDLAAFVRAHPQTRVVFHNVAFDYWVVHRHLTDSGEKEALVVWMGLARRRRLRDTMLLDMLVSIAGGASREVRRRDLGVIAQEYAGLEIDKDDPYRTRYAEIVGANWSDIDPGFLEYAIKDAIATARAYPRLRSAARRIMDEAGFDPDAEADGKFKIRPDAVRRFGVLSEAIQVQAAIALDAIGRTGMTTDAKALSRVKRKYERALAKEVRRLDENYPGLFKLDKDGQFVRTAKTGVPSKSMKFLDEFLLHAAEEIAQTTGVKVPIPRTPKGQIGKSMDLWEPLAGKHPFLKAWVRYEHAAKLSQFPTKLNAPVIRPRYSVLKRTGRTGCSSPNVQQIPKEDAFRHVIAPSAGHLLLIVDYKFIELVTLAAVCLSRFGESRLAEVIRQGVDPHCYTAALLKEMTYKQFMALKKKSPDEFKKWRQMAKPVNFGVPGGMGADSLRQYARKTYGVEMSAEDAEGFHRRLVEEVYPELGPYLRDRSMEILAKSLKTSVGALWSRLDRDGQRSAGVAGGVRRVVAGTPWKADGTPYAESYVKRVWEALAEANHNVELDEKLRDRVGDEALAERLFFTSVPTLTGRVRGGVTYTSERNSQFQGLAADGGKLALARLVLAGYRVVGFVHDEVLIELPDEGGYVSRAVVEDVVRHLTRGMEEVTCGVPVECEYALATCWSKGAQLIERKDRIYAWNPTR